MSLNVNLGETLSNARVLIVGGSSGIGEAAALLAAQAGAQVCIASRSTAREQAALARLPAGVQGEVLDVRDDEAVQAFEALRLYNDPPRISQWLAQQVALLPEAASA